MKGIFFPTLKFILATIILAAILGGIVWMLISPFNKLSFFIIGKLNQPFKEKAYQEIQKIENSSVIKNPLLNYTAQTDEFEQQLIEARRNDERFWLIAGLIAFVLCVIFYTAWTERKRGGIGA